MTKSEIEQKERDAILAADALAVMLLSLFGKKDRAGVELVRYDAAKGRFYYKGKSVSVKQVREYLLRIETRSAKALAELTDKLLRGEITIDEWKRSFDSTITNGHILAGALALGGIAVAVRNADVIALLTAELLYADKFTDQIRKGTAGTDAQILARARSYPRAIHRTFINAELEARKLMGVQRLARNVRRAIESCKSSRSHIGCKELSLKGWINIEDMIPIGDRVCGRYCRCYIEYR